MLVIRMQRTGRKRQPSFRLIVQDKTRSPRSKAVEIVGFYNPRTKEKGFNQERIAYWLGHGAQPTDTVNNLFVDAGLITTAKRRVVHLSETRRAAIAEKAEKAEKAAVVAAVPVVVPPAPEPVVEPVAEPAPAEPAPVAVPEPTRESASAESAPVEVAPTEPTPTEG